ncbi:MAG: hypothetical protein GQ535_15835 [Rhodobacteraceae bacterium]|nr:hypothetical protein [Paracoccaceae bacterium]
MTNPTGMEDLLDEGEVIRWQGRPDSTNVWFTMQYVSLVLGLAVSAFAVIWMMQAAKESGWGWAFGLIFLCFGIFITLALPYGSPYFRSKKRYALTNWRALIITDLPILGRKIKSYPITPQSPLEIDTRYKSSVYFATKAARSARGAYKIKIGFELIDDAEQVLALLQEIQKETK